MLNGVASVNSNDVAALFSKHLNSVYADSIVDYVPSTVSHLFHDLSSNCFFDLSQVENELAKLKNNKSVSSVGFFYTLSDLRFIFYFGFCFARVLTMMSTQRYSN